MKQTETLGVDIGGVIIDRINDNTDTSFFSKNYLETTAVPHAFRILSRLVKRRFGERVYLISKCGPVVQGKTLEWLAHHKFHEQTGISSTHVHFCLARHEKADVCRDLKVTHFIDDRLEVLGYLVGLVPHLYLFNPDSKEVAASKKYLSKVRMVNSWPEIERSLLKKAGRLR